MTKIKRIEGIISAEGKRIGIVASRFNDFITERLIEGCLDALLRHNADPQNITVVKVPGAFEIPSVAKRMALSGNYDAVICLGCVIRGDTPHFEYVAAEVAKGVALVNLEASLPVIFGVITADTIEQAIERAGTKAGNKGADAAISAMETISIYHQI